MNLCIYIDGGARGNPGPAAAGVTIHAGDPSKPLHEAGYFLGHTTNNIAEYKGLLLALSIAVQMGADQVSVHSDSQLLVQQILGKYRVSSPALKPLHERANKLLQPFAKWKITHVRREYNRRADELANMAMDQRDDVIVTTVPKDVAAGELAQSGQDAGAEEHATVTPPSWSVQLSTDPGPVCPARQPAGRSYHFGSTTPEGFCIYATRAVLEDTLDRASSSVIGPIQSHCRRCGVSITVQSVPSR